MSQRIAFTVHGRVQGVCFRMDTVDNAKRIGVTGFVKNASDGSVTGEAQGSTDAIKDFVSYLHKGPSAAKVSDVDQKDIDVKQSESSFYQN
ncbi:Acylphosphatase [Aulographum hederae CBS 113979]|uniref:Acylphosphatase n=1 Tax=Aulographum hederae CBS 113979 TaxID=1176131 RepID=A0A6G1GWV5_9PEZI|nr:Acylphosphatase [Aulographum hederae CBS 113979]